MKTIDLRQNTWTLDDVLDFAQFDMVTIFSKDGRIYVLEEADDFEEEVAQLGKSAQFIRFLQERGQEKGSISLEEIERKLAIS